jgi:hypothetical protein
VPRFVARGSAHAQVQVLHDDPELVMFDWEVTVPEDGRPPTFAIYDDREVDAIPRFLQVCSGEAAELIHRLADALSPKESASRAPACGVLALVTFIANWVS